MRVTVLTVALLASVAAAHAKQFESKGEVVVEDGLVYVAGVRLSEGHQGSSQSIVALLRQHPGVSVKLRGEEGLKLLRERRPPMVPSMIWPPVQRGSLLLIPDSAGRVHAHPVHRSVGVGLEVVGPFAEAAGRSPERAIWAAYWEVPGESQVHLLSLFSGPTVEELTAKTVLGSRFSSGRLRGDVVWDPERSCYLFLNQENARYYRLAGVGPERLSLLYQRTIELAGWAIEPEREGSVGRILVEELLSPRHQIVQGVVGLKPRPSLHTSEGQVWVVFAPRAPLGEGQYATSTEAQSRLLVALSGRSVDLEGWAFLSPSGKIQDLMFMAVRTSFRVSENPVRGVGLEDDGALLTDTGRTVRPETVSLPLVVAEVGGVEALGAEDVLRRKP